MFNFLCFLTRFLLCQQEPLNPLHLLWVNLVTDGPPATALGFNPSDPGVMKVSPRPRDEPVLSSWLLFRYVITGLYVGAATIGAFSWWYMDKGVSFARLSNWDKCPSWGEDFSHTLLTASSDSKCGIFGAMRVHPQSLSLSVLVTIEMLKALSSVSLDSSLLQVQPWQNPWLIWSVLFPFLLHVAVLYVPSLANLFGLAPLSLREWKVLLVSPCNLHEQPVAVPHFPNLPPLLFTYSKKKEVAIEFLCAFLEFLCAFLIYLISLSIPHTSHHFRWYFFFHCPSSSWKKFSSTVDDIKRKLRQQPIENLRKLKNMQKITLRLYHLQCSNLVQ